MDFINKHFRTFFILVLVLLIISIVITGTQKYSPKTIDKVFGFIIVPVQKALYDGGQNFNALFKQKHDIDELQAENEELKAQISELIDENKRLSLFEVENDELSQLLNINKKYPDYEKLGVHIISSDTSNWFNVFTIDRGSDDGVMVDMFVVAEGGLAGRIFEVSDKYSKMMAVIDDRSAIHGQSRQTEDIGVVKGDTQLMRQGLCGMNFIDLEAKMRVGDEIITSVFSEIYPAGITIGYVKEINPSADGLTKSAIITPSVDFANMNKAMVMLRKK